MSEMDETPTTQDDSSHALAPLRREALLPTERTRGLGTVAIVCTMAGVASGLALATTLMAMQVADSMSNRPCPYRQQQITMPNPCDHAYLGIQFGEAPHGVVDVVNVYKDTPAAAVGLQPGDHLLTVDGMPVHSIRDMRHVIRNWRIGNMPTLMVERQGTTTAVHPRLVAWPY